MTKKRHGWGARALAATGVATLGLVTLAGTAVATPQNDAPWLGTAPTSGTLTLYKHVEDASSTDGNPAGAALEGVTFQISTIGTGTQGSCTAINLRSPVGWRQFGTLNSLWNGGDGSLPVGYCTTGTTFTATTVSTGAATFANTPVAAYLVTETGAGSNLITTPADPFLMTLPLAAGNQWEYSPVAYPKNVLTEPGIPTKTAEAANIAGTSALTWNSDATVPWTITATIPEATLPYTDVVVTDSADTGLNPVVFSAALNGTDLAITDYVAADAANGKLTLTTAGLDKVNALTPAGDVTLTVVIHTTVTPGTTGRLYNGATLTLNGTVSDPITNKPETKWGELSINKHVYGDATDSLAGAEFKVWPASGTPGAETCETTAPATGTLDIGPTVVGQTLDTILWVSNAAGTTNKAYCVQETVAPQGYILNPEVTKVDLGSGSFTLPIANEKAVAPELPLTGGTGTLILSVAGVGVLGLALFAAIRRRKNADA
ncbi:SpaH/EbpB family LPXTG-anchored major pilin [Actinomycetaceae bacterium MB13-C1-2]|nr:SpaH/EbpB family LPXTG-anchored major pilin [Actinomycetaceae bacterium MB13-C1-2]